MKKHRPLILLIVIYLAFISLGLPDGVLGIAWPSLRAELGLPLESMGVLTSLLLVISALSSFFSGKVIRRFGTGGITFLSCAVTGAALLGYSLAPSMAFLILFTIPLGLGQGAVDSGLNAFVAEHYTARHMNWLHCFWGIGASLGPMMMTGAITGTLTWRGGYRLVAATQLFLAVVLLGGLLSRLWKHVPPKEDRSGAHTQGAEKKLSAPASQFLAVLLFFLCVGMEYSVGSWLNSILVESRGLPVPLAGAAVTVFYASIMTGRFLSGILVAKIGNVRMIRIGMLCAATGCALVGFLHHSAGTIIGTSLIGLGLAPIYPCLMHETPSRFQRQLSDRLIGYQVGAACLGGAVVSAGMGVLLSRLGMELLFPALLLLLLVACAANETLLLRLRRLNR